MTDYDKAQQEADWVANKAVDLMSCEHERLIDHLTNNVINGPDFCDEEKELLALCVKLVDILPPSLQGIVARCANKAAQFEHDNQDY